MKAFVLLSSKLDVSEWAKEFAEGKVPDAAPYGYNYAVDYGCSVTFSHRFARGFFPRIFDVFFKLLFGFELTHAFRNLNVLKGSGCDVVWTHTEREFLPLLLLKTIFTSIKVPVLAQSVWLADDWEQNPWWHRSLAEWLCRKAAVCTFHSPINTEWAIQNQLCPNVTLIHFGVSELTFPFVAPTVAPNTTGMPIRVLAIGNDKHRDWTTFSAAFLQNHNFDVRVASSTFVGAQSGSNWLAKPCTLAEIKDLYRWCDVVVIPLTKNMHASGLTTLIEATLMGKPVVATGVGGLDDYLSATEVAYTAVGDSDSLRKGVLDLIAVSNSSAIVLRAQAAVGAKQLTSRGFARRHVELSREILIDSKGKEI